MKKRILFIVATMALFACLLAITVGADTIVSSTSDEYGTLCQFDEAIGNTQISSLKDDGTVARTVLTDGNGNYYTIPTVYTLTEHHKNRGAGVEGEMFNLSFGEISTKLGFTVSKNSIIRIEFPSDIKFICNGNENLSGCINMVECIMNDGVYFWDDSTQRKVFTNCKKLKSIDVSGMVMDRASTTFAMFEYCPELEYVKLPDAYLQDDGTYMDYNTSHMFSGCNKLKTIENMEGFFKGDKTLNYKTFYNCWVLEEIVLPQGLEKIDGRAIGLCNAITTIVIPDTVTVIGTGETVFEACASLKNIVFPSGAVSVGNYAFEKCKVLTDIWMPGEGSTFGKEVFGQCGSGRAVNFYFTTATNTITISDKTNKDDPFITALNSDGDARLKYSTPLSTKCEVFLGGHDYKTGYVFGTVYDAVTLETACSRSCGADSQVQNLGVIIEEKGYSTSNINGIRSFTRGYYVNKELLALYEEQKGVSVEIGFAFGLGTNYNPSAEPTLDDFQIVMPLKTSGNALEVNNLDYMMRYKNDKHLSVEVVIAGYVLENGAVTFGGEIERVSYKSLVGDVEVTEGTGDSVDASVSIEDLLG